MIYINRVYHKVLETHPLVISLSFVNNLGFTALSTSLESTVKILKNIPQKVFNRKD